MSGSTRDQQSQTLATLGTAENGSEPKPPDTLQAAGGLAVDRIKEAQDNIASLSAGVTVDKTEELAHDKHHTVDIEAGTRLQCQLDEGGFLLSATPGILVKGAGEDLHVDMVRYDFATASFQSHASVRFDIFGAYANLAERKMNHVLDQALKPLLPANVQKAGYDPKTDPDVKGTMRNLAAHFPSSPSGSAFAQGLSGASVAQTLLVKRELRVPLGMDGVELYIKPGTDIELELSTTGDVQHPKLKSCLLTSDSGIVLRKSEGSAQQLSIKRVEILPGGVFRFEYDLLPEHLLGLFMMLGAAATSRSHLEMVARASQVKPPQLTAVRETIDEKLQAAVPKRFHDFLMQYDQAVPGYSLREIFE